MAEAIIHEPDATKRPHALLRHELKIVSAGLGAISRKPLDLLTVLIALPILLLVVRAWTAGQPEQLVDLQAFAVGFAVAFYCVKALLYRCLYHRTDGILAAHAQRMAEYLAFALPLFGASITLGFAYLLIVDASRPVVWLAATMLGATAGFAWGQIARLIAERRPMLLRWLRPRRQPRTLAVAAVGVFLGAAIALVPLPLPAIAIATAAISLTAGIFLAGIDAAVIRYRTMVGHSSATIIGSRIAPLSAFFGPFAAGLTLAPHWAPAALAAALGVAVICFSALRILAYQSFDARIADWFVTLLIGAVAMVGLAFPFAAPVALLVGTVWLVRRAALQSWLIA